MPPLFLMLFYCFFIGRVQMMYNKKHPHRINQHECFQQIELTTKDAEAG